MRLFTGTYVRDGSACFGLRTAHGVGMSCRVDMSGETPLQVGETTSRGYRMVSGLVSHEVEAVSVINVRGRDFGCRSATATFEQKKTPVRLIDTTRFHSSG